MKITGKTGMDREAQLSIDCRSQAVVPVTVHDLTVDRAASKVKVVLRLDDGTTAEAVETDELGQLHFTVMDMNEGQRIGGTLTVANDTEIVKTRSVEVTAGEVCPATVNLGSPKLHLKVQPIDPLTSDALKKAYEFLRSYAGAVNVYDSFKKVDHQYRKDPEGPVEELPAYLACSQTGARDEKELAYLSDAFRRTVAAFAAGIQNCYEVTITLAPRWIAGDVTLSAVESGSADLCTASGDAMKLPHKFALPLQDGRFVLKRKQTATVTIRAELVRADDIVTSGGAIDTKEEVIPFKATEIMSVREACVVFRKLPRDYDRFLQAAAPWEAEIIKLARIAAVYWYSDTGDVLMNAYLRGGDLAKKLEERVAYLREYYKDDDAMKKKLPTVDQISANVSLYAQQIDAQVQMLRDALASDLLEIPKPDLQLYRGMSFQAGTDIGQKFVLNQPSQLRGFSSSAVDPKVAYRFMKDNASDMNVLKLSALKAAQSPQQLHEREKRIEVYKAKLSDKIQNYEKKLVDAGQQLDELTGQLTALDKEIRELKEKTADKDQLQTKALERQKLVRTRETVAALIAGLEAKIRGIKNAVPPEELAQHDAAVPILYRIQTGAEHGRLLGPYSRHHGEEEVLFADGVFPTPLKMGMIVIELQKGPFGASKNTQFKDCDDEATSDSGFAYAKTQLGQDLNTAQVRGNPETYWKYEEAKAQGASLGLEWPHGPGILLVTARMG